MTDELDLYNTNRDEWLRFVAPNLARKLATDTDEQVQRNWPTIPADYKAAVWEHLDATQRERIRRLRKSP